MTGRNLFTLIGRTV